MKNNKNDHYSFFVIISIVIVFVVTVICCIIADELTPNRASIIGGALSAIATVFLGLIAFWQSKKYKELSDEFNDKIYMPELFKADTLGEKLNGLGKAVYNSFTYNANMSNICNTETVKIDCGIFMVLKAPIIDVCVENISYKNNNLHFIDEKRSIYTPDTAFHLFIIAPADFVKNDTSFSIVFKYKNIFDIEYEKRASFTLNDEKTYASNWKLKKATKI